MDAALASSAAPTYFPPHPIGDRLYADGGLIANSPDAVALVESTAGLGWPIHSLHLLSVGTTATPTGLPNNPNAHWGLARWGWKLTLLEQMMTAQAKLSLDSARLTLGSRFGLIDAMRGDAQNQAVGLDRASDTATKTLLGLADAAWERWRAEEAHHCLELSYSRAAFTRGVLAARSIDPRDVNFRTAGAAVETGAQTFDDPHLHAPILYPFESGAILRQIIGLHSFAT